MKRTWSSSGPDKAFQDFASSLETFSTIQLDSDMISPPFRSRVEEVSLKLALRLFLASSLDSVGKIFASLALSVCSTQHSFGDSSVSSHSLLPSEDYNLGGDARALNGFRACLHVPTADDDKPADSTDVSCAVRKNASNLVCGTTNEQCIQAAKNCTC